MKKYSGILQRPTFENILTWAGILTYILLASVPVLSAVFRFFGGAEIPLTSTLVFYLTVMLAGLSGIQTEAQNEHLSVDLGFNNRDTPFFRGLRIIRDLAGTFFLTQFIIGSLEMLFVAFTGERFLGLPVQVFVFFIPLGFTIIGFYWLKRSGKKGRWRFHVPVILLAGFFSLPSILNILYTMSPTIPDIVFAIENFWYGIVPAVIPVFIVLLLILIPAGLPLYLCLGGIGLMFFLRDGSGAAIIMYEGYAVLNSTAIPAIALFTLTGFLLSESKASKRLVEVFVALFGWFPGGIVIATVLVSCVFTTFTGASGVTILALGGLLFGLLNGTGRYTENFSVGLITSSGSIGLLFPPSLAIILYGSVAQINIRHVFLAGVIPGIILIVVWSIFGIGMSMRSHSTVNSFDVKRAGKAVREAVWELLIPVITIVLYFSGIATLLETSAAAMLYTLFVECIVKREITTRELKIVFSKSMKIIGGIFIILMLAKGLSAYIIDAQVPQNFAAFVQNSISSRFLFLILLNLALILTGMLMDIYSAIFVVVPLMLPLGDAFGIHPLHLGMIFLINLELGFMTPPVGLNLFFSSYRFKKPLSQVYKSIVPFLFLLLGIVLLVTFVPQLSLLLVPE
ncbi:MAG: TRAP transporter large permease subunit [Salinispira sp.]